MESVFYTKYEYNKEEDINKINEAYKLIKKYENDNLKIFLIEKSLPYIYICGVEKLNKDI